MLQTKSGTSNHVNTCLIKKNSHFNLQYEANHWQISSKNVRQPKKPRKMLNVGNAMGNWPPLISEILTSDKSHKTSQ